MYYDDGLSTDFSLEDLANEDDYREPEPRPLTITEFLDSCNETLYYNYEMLEVIGEVASFKINQGKWVFFDLKDEKSSVGCFLSVWDLRVPLEDGMKVVVRAYPKVTKWGRFSLTVSYIMPVGEGSIKKSLELLKKKLAAEGLFDPAKKRPLPDPLRRIGVISSTQAAGYADFIKILNERWGGLKVEVAHTQVQGLTAADQIIRALDYFNQKGTVDIIAILRGGGSADDLAVFNDEKLVRAIAASRIPTITGIGHEIDESLADLAADIRASTPSNAAQMLTRDRHQYIAALRGQHESLTAYLLSEINRLTPSALLAPAQNTLLGRISDLERHNLSQIQHLHRQTVVKITTLQNHLRSQQKILAVLNPDKVLSQGYAILKGKISPGSALTITTFKQIITAEIKDVQPRK